MTRLGLECVLYYNTGTYASPTWVEALNVVDTNVPLSKGEADVSRRGRKWKLRRGTLKDASIDFNMRQEDGDPAFGVFMNSFMNSAPVELLALNGPIDEPGSQGLRAVCEIFKNDDSQQLEEGETYDYSAKPTMAETDPEWYVVPEEP